MCGEGGGRDESVWGGGEVRGASERDAPKAVVCCHS